MMTGKVQAFIEDPLLQSTSVAVCVMRVDTGKVVTAHQADTALIPASTLKVLTTAAALDLLGADFCFETRLEIDGEVDAEGTLQGNLRIVGGGDPTLGSDRIDESSQILEDWTTAVKLRGIRRIEGRIIGDASCWEEALAAPSWRWEDLGNYFGAGACGLSFRENSYTLTFRPGEREGEPCELLKIEPEIPGLRLQNEVTTGPINSGDQAWIFGCEYSYQQVIRGTLPAGKPSFSIRGAIPHPARYCAQALDAALKGSGIEVSGEATASTQSHQQGEVIHRTLSPPLSEIIYWTNRKSINLYAEHLLKQLGGGTLKAGAEVIRNYWINQEIDLTGSQISDGSGLSSTSLITARQFAEILRVIAQKDNFPLFLRSLVEGDGNGGGGGGGDGDDSSYCYKSGYASGIYNRVGYITTCSGERLVFAIMVNHYLGKKKELIDLFDRFLR